ncbi:MAG: hypothetical protein IJ329_01415 [Clostridia bacterium]|nr:hypothetical protein [Clostridia bacterium]
MYCKYCGKEVAENAVVCLNCGGWIQAEVKPRKQKEYVNGMAIAGFVCSFFIPLLGWIFGGIGLNKANKNNGKGKGLAIAAIAVASASFLLGILL